MVVKRLKHLRYITVMYIRYTVTFCYNFVNIFMLVVNKTNAVNHPDFRHVCSWENYTGLLGIQINWRQCSGNILFVPKKMWPSNEGSGQKRKELRRVYNLYIPSLIYLRKLASFVTTGSLQKNTEI